ncbi:MAG: RDD family protein [Caldilineaceae bacterium]|nr:RDD family protein [Caldilineaceae bacterium]
MTDYPMDPKAGSQADRHARDHRTSHDQLSEEYTIDTPENVSFGYEVAGIGSRFIAALVDHLILGLLLVGLNIAIVVLLSSLAGDTSSIEQSLEETPEDWVAGLLIALYALFNFAIWWGYYLLFEWLWHGQTVGKRIAHIRVVRLDGAPVGFVPVAVRNLVRIVDFLPMGYGVGVVTMFCNRQARRLGDFAAGTLVVKDQGELTLNALLTPVPAITPPLVPQPVSTSEAMAEAAPDITPEITPDQDWSGIRRLTAADYELVQETLARYRAGNLDRALLARVATAIATKLDRAPSSQLDQSAADPVHFLADVATAYVRWVK